MSTEERPTHCYVGYAACGCAKSIGVDMRDKHTAKWVAEMIKNGQYVERYEFDVAHREFRAGQECECKPVIHQERQAKLFPDETEGNN